MPTRYFEVAAIHTIMKMMKVCVIKRKKQHLKQLIKILSHLIKKVN